MTVRKSKPKIIKTPTDFVNWLETTGERTSKTSTADDSYREAAKRRNRKEGQQERRLMERVERIKKLKAQLKKLKIREGRKQ
jgi:hypothetical protein